MKRLNVIIDKPHLITKEELNIILANDNRMKNWPDNLIPNKENSEQHQDIVNHMNALLNQELDYSSFIKILDIYILFKESGAL